MKAIIIILVLLFGAGATYAVVSSKMLKGEEILGGGKEITVYKSPTCGCCGNYVAYLKREGFDVKVVSVNNMDEIKDKYGVPSGLQSCHTAVAGNYFIEGHVPIEAVNKLLDEKPNIAGISLPGMPGGSPGMGGAKSGLFKIFGIDNKGNGNEFISI